MSDALGFSSEIDLAKAVVNGNESERWEMLKRYYVDKNPILSGLSSFTRTTSGENVNEKQVGEGETSLERKRKDYNNDTAKNSKRNLRKRKSKPESYGRDPCFEENLERHEIKHFAGKSSCSRGKKPYCAATVSKGSHRIQHESFGNDPAMNDERANSEDKGNCGLEVTRTRHLHQTNQLEQRDVKSTSKASKGEFVSETEASYLENASEPSSSILDEFLINDYSKCSAEVEDSDRRVNKWKRNSQKERKQLDKTKEKEIIKGKKNSTSVLDEFI